MRKSLKRALKMLFSKGNRCPNFAPNERSDFNSVNCSELTKVTNCLKFLTIATFELPKAVPIIHLIDSRLINDNGKLQLQEDSPACTLFRKIQTGHSLLRTGGRTCTPLWILNGRSLSRRRVHSFRIWRRHRTWSSTPPFSSPLQSNAGKKL